MSKVAIQADCSKEIGKIKPMHAVNNGPTGTEGDATGNFDAYKAAKIPFARNHDAAFYASYGGEHIVDMQAVFPDFSKDENDESAYHKLVAYGAQRQRAVKSCDIHIMVHL